MSVKVNPNISALPLIIKPWHKAVVRWNKINGMYISSFEGPGYKKELFRTQNIPTPQQFENFGFSQYEIKYKNTKNFVNVNVAPNKDVNGSICWISIYDKWDVISYDNIDVFKGFK